MNSAKKTIGIILPTNRPEYCFKHVLSAKSIEQIARLCGKFNVQFLIVGQGAFDEIEAMKAEGAASQFGIEVKFKFEKQEKVARMARLRQMCAELNPDADYYLSIDDNFIFVDGSSDSYADAISCLEENEKFGIVACAGIFGSVNWTGKIEPCRSTRIISTGKGMVIKNCFSGKIFHSGAIRARGGAEEMAICLYFNLNGYLVCRQFRNPTIHKDLKKIGFDYGEKDNGIHSAEIANEGIFHWIREFVSPTYKFGDQIINKRLLDGCDFRVSEVVKESWNKRRLNKNTNAESKCTVDGKHYKNVGAAFADLGLPMNKMKKLRRALKISGEEAVNVDGRIFTFKLEKEVVK